MLVEGRTRRCRRRRRAPRPRRRGSPAPRTAARRCRGSAPGGSRPCLQASGSVNDRSPLDGQGRSRPRPLTARHPGRSLGGTGRTPRSSADPGGTMQTDELADHLFALRPRRAGRAHGAHRGPVRGLRPAAPRRAADRRGGRGALRHAPAVRPRVARAADRGRAHRRRRPRPAGRRSAATRCSDEHAAVLADRDSLAFFTPFARMVAAAAVQLPALQDAYRTGGGVGWEAFGPLMRTAQADANRPLYLGPLAREWLPALPEVHRDLTAGGRVADIGCGEGWSSIGIALGYPAARVDGFDVDPASVDAARRHAASYGVGRPGLLPPRRRRDGGHRWSGAGRGRRLRPGHRLRVHPRPARPGVRAGPGPGPGASRGHGAGDGREGARGRSPGPATRSSS